MAFTYTRGGAYKSCATAEQGRQLAALGWTLVSGSADDTTALGEFPSYLEDFGGAPSNPTFRGDGLSGELQTNLGYIIKQVQPGLSKTDYDAIKEAFYNDELKTASTFTNISVVDALPDEPVLTTIYLLRDGDGSPVDGMYISNSNDWVAYTPGDIYDVNYGADTEMALLASYTSSAAFTALPIATENTKAAIEAILLAELQAVVDGGEAQEYTVSFVSSTYNTTTGVWSGKIKVLNDTNAADTFTDATARTFRFGAFVAMKLITDEAITTVPVGTADTKSGVEAAMLILANAAISAMTGYVVSVNAAPVSTYNTDTNAWVGKLKVVETANAATNLFIDASARAITVVIAES